MTTDQVLACMLIAAMMGVFVWGRWRFDLVATGALLAGVALGVIPFEEAFTGFSNDIVIIVGSALLVSAGVRRSGIMEIGIQRMVPTLSNVRIQVLILVGVVAVMSAIVKNIGALAIMIPVAFQFAKRSKVSASVFLMPMAFASLIGGLMTLVGTSPNIIVSQMREELGGEPFGMFDFTPVGASIALLGCIFLTLFYWLLPNRKRLDTPLEEAIDIKNYMAEARVTEKSAALGKTISDLLKPGEGAASVTSLLRQHDMRVSPFADAVLQEDDILLIEGDHEALDKVIAGGGLKLSENRPLQPDKDSGEIEAVEAVIGEQSVLIGLSARRLALYHRFNVNLVALSRKGERIRDRLADTRFLSGDVILLQGAQNAMPDTLRELGLLPLAARQIKLGSVRKGLLPLGILLVAMAATATGAVPVAVAFFAAAVAMVAIKAVPVREVYAALDGPILVMLAALIPVSDTLSRTGVADLAGAWLADVATVLPAWGALALILVAAMAVTPFLNNAATVLVMAPVAAAFAGGLGYRPDAFLMAVAIGAGCDFLTPIGHQANTLVMGPGGYRFSDYPRLGLPLSVLVVIAAVPLLIIVWPLQ